MKLKPAKDEFDWPLMPSGGQNPTQAVDALSAYAIGDARLMVSELLLPVGARAAGQTQRRKAFAPAPTMTPFRETLATVSSPSATSSTRVRPAKSLGVGKTVEYCHPDAELPTHPLLGGAVAFRAELSPAYGSPMKPLARRSRCTWPGILAGTDTGYPGSALVSAHVHSARSYEVMGTGATRAAAPLATKATARAMCPIWAREQTRRRDLEMAHAYFG